MALKVILLLHKYWLFTLLFSFKYLSKHIGDQGSELKFDLTPNEKRYLIFILKIFNGINKYWIYKFRCLVQVIAASKLLRKKKIPYTLFLGVKKEKSKIQAHAWLRSDNIYVIGSTQGEYEIISFFNYTPSQE